MLLIALSPLLLLLPHTNFHSPVSFSLPISYYFPFEIYSVFHLRFLCHSLHFLFNPFLLPFYCIWLHFSCLSTLPIFSLIQPLFILLLSLVLTSDLLALPKISDRGEEGEEREKDMRILLPVSSYSLYATGS